MNKQRFRLVFSQRMGMLVPVAEDRTARGKASGDGVAGGGTSSPSSRSSTDDTRPWRTEAGLDLRKLVVGLISAWQLGFMLVAPMRAYAAPAGASVASGTASITRAGDLTTIVNSPNAIINWASFSAAQQEVIRFVQQSAASAVLNRVTGQDPSVILGQLLSNGRVFLINPNGVVFGAGSRVDTAGLVASTLGITNADFLAGRYRFGKDAAGAAAGTGVRSSGLITVSHGGSVALLGDSVTQAGLIRADDGTVLLAAGRSITLTDLSNPAIAVVVSAPEHRVLNVGEIFAASGQVALIAAAVGQQGRVNVDSVGQDAAGRIVLSATDSVSVGADAVLSARGHGATHGGTILVGSQETAHTAVHGTLDAHGGAEGGDGGFIETSGRRVELGGIRVDAGSDRGRGGTWLIDPVNINLANGTAGAISYPTTGEATITDGTISAALNTGTNVNITTSAANVPDAHGDINVGAAFNVVKTAGAPASLTLSADNDINLSQPFSISSSDTGGALDVSLLAGGNISTRSHVPFTIATHGGNVVIGGPHDGGANTVNLFGGSNSDLSVIDTRVDRQSNQSIAGTIGIKANLQGTFSGPVSALATDDLLLFGDGIEMSGVIGASTTSDATLAVNMYGARIHNTGSRDIDVRGAYTYTGRATNFSALAMRDRVTVEQHGDGDIVIRGDEYSTSSNGLLPPASNAIVLSSGAVFSNLGNGNLDVIGIAHAPRSTSDAYSVVSITDTTLAARNGNVTVRGDGVAGGGTLLNQISVRNANITASNDVTIDARYVDASGKLISSGGFLMGAFTGTDCCSGRGTIAAGGSFNVAASVVAGLTGDSIHARDVHIDVVSDGVTALQFGGGIPNSQIGTSLMSDGFLQALGAYGNVTGNITLTSDGEIRLMGGSNNLGATPLGNVRIATPRDVRLDHDFSTESVVITSGGNITGAASLNVAGNGNVRVAGTGRAYDLDLSRYSLWVNAAVKF